MSETRRHRRSLLVQDSYIPPPSQFGGGGFRSFASTAVLDREPELEAAPDQEVFDQLAPVVQDAPNLAPAVAEEDVEEPVIEPSFDELIWGHNEAGDQVEIQSDRIPRRLSPRESSQQHGELATVSLVVSLAGIVTGVGFVAGTVMGHVALIRIGRAGWFRSDELAARRARNAVSVGYIGMTALLCAGILVSAWLLVKGATS
ncbi:UNVERIFIED_ORG: hypothetical protein ABIB52_000545 [Arthrobacter sp. UYCu721]